MKCSVRKNVQIWLLLGSVCLNAVLGIFLRQLDLQKDARILLAYPGEIFFRFVKMMMTPLVTTSIITSSATINVKRNAALVVRTFAYFIGTQMISAALGVLIGSRINFKQSENEFNSTIVSNSSQTQFMDHILDIGRNLIPDNLVTAGFELTFTKQQEDGSRSLEARRGVNMMGVVFFSFLFGSVIGAKKKQNVIHFFKSCFESLLVILSGVMWVAPIGIGSIVLSTLLETPDLMETVENLALFIVIVAAGLIFYQLIVLQLIYFLLTRKNPYQLYNKLFEPIVTAFTLASTLATLPTTFRAVDTKVKMNKRVSRFVLPLGVTLNTDGSAMFICISALFVCQIQNHILTGSQIIVIWILSTVLSMAMGSVPSSSLICLMGVLNGIAVPADGVKELFAVDFFADRLRTTNNMLGDVYGASVVEHYSSKQLKSIPDEEATELSESINHKS